MPLIVETGAGMANADSYINLLDARALAAQFGYTLPDDDAAAEVALRNGAAYVDLHEQRFSGHRLKWTQSMAWPRTGASTSFGAVLAHNVVPQQVLKAQVMAAAEYGKGTDIRATDDGKEVASKEVTGAVAISYFQNGKTGGEVVITRAVDALKPLMTAGTSSASFRVTRG